METVGTTEAAYLLSICTQRVRQLLSQERIKGAKKVGRFWRIPLFQGMPKIIPGRRGPKGRWRKKIPCAHTKIHVNKYVLAHNQAKNTRYPVLIVRRGKKEIYCHELEIYGPSKLVYRPDTRNTGGAVIWLEVDPSILIKTHLFQDYDPQVIKNIKQRRLTS